MTNQTSPRYKQEIKQMMYVSGETSDPLIETLTLVEEIIRAQVAQILTTGTEISPRRGSRLIKNNDVIFQYRHDANKVSRLQNFLPWKEVGKKAKEHEKSGDIDPGDDLSVAAGGIEDTAKKIKKSKVALPWDTSSFYSQTVPESYGEDEDEEMNEAKLLRLRKADERTKDMTKEEYVMWAENRQASFTYNKTKKFRDWAGIGVNVEVKKSEDVIEILGFLIFEMVQMLTKQAIKVKEQEDSLGGMNGSGGASFVKETKLNAPGYPGLFAMPREGRAAVQPKHVQAAFSNLQSRPKKGRITFNKTPQNSTIKLI